VVSLVQRFAYEIYVHRNPVILLAIFLFLLGMQFIMMGLMAELIIRTYHESQDKPIYSIAEVVGFQTEPESAAAHAE
jgi:hypothetical protein